MLSISRSAVLQIAFIRVLCTLFLSGLAENLQIPKDVSRDRVYEAILPQIKALTKGEPDFTANVANMMAVLKSAFNFWWIGCYFVRPALQNGDSAQAELVLGPFQGPVACTRISIGRGVCGTAWAENRSILVPDVELFPGHIACSAESRSEVVIPLRTAAGTVFGVLDIDSSELNDFNQSDVFYLEKIAAIISDLYEA